MKIRILAAVFILPLWLTLITFNASADSRVEGAKRNDDVIVGPAWVILTQVTINIPTGQIWHCMATGSADASFPNDGGVNNRYRFTLTLDELNPADDGPCERTLEFNDNFGISDTHLNAINTTCPFKKIAEGTHTINWLGKKISKSRNLTITDNSLTVVCSNHLI